MNQASFSKRCLRYSKSINSADTKRSQWKLLPSDLRVLRYRFPSVSLRDLLKVATKKLTFHFTQLNWSMAVGTTAHIRARVSCFSSFHSFKCFGPVNFAVVEDN